MKVRVNKILKLEKNSLLHNRQSICLIMYQEFYSYKMRKPPFFTLGSEKLKPVYYNNVDWQSNNL